MYIIGRYNHLRPERLSGFKREFRNLEVDFITAHSSKGVQRDFVIVTGLSSYGYAFPSQIVDDPILELVLAKKEKVSNAEERARARRYSYNLPLTADTNINLDTNEAHYLFLRLQKRQIQDR